MKITITLLLATLMISSTVFCTAYAAPTVDPWHIKIYQLLEKVYNSLTVDIENKLDGIEGKLWSRADSLKNDTTKIYNYLTGEIEDKLDWTLGNLTDVETNNGWVLGNLSDKLTIKEVIANFPADSGYNSTHLFYTSPGGDYYRIEISSNENFQVKAVYIDLNDPDGVANITFYSTGDLRGVKLHEFDFGRNFDIKSDGWNPDAADTIAVELLSYLGLTIYPAGSGGDKLYIYLTLENPGAIDYDETLYVKAVVETAQNATVTLDWY